METLRLKQIREAERKSHMEIYTKKELYAEGTWLSKPIKTVMDLLPLFAENKELAVLDLGCGVGRNCIPFAREYAKIPCEVVGVDILEIAIKKLKENAEKYGVGASVHGIVKPLEEYAIAQNKFDCIMAVSALEHVENEAAFYRKLSEMKNGVRNGGVVCLVISTEITEMFQGRKIEPQFEVNLPSEQLQKELKELFAGWQLLKNTAVRQQYEIPREIGAVELTAEVVTYVVRKRERSEAYPEA